MQSTIKTMENGFFCDYELISKTKKIFNKLEEQVRDLQYFLKYGEIENYTKSVWQKQPSKRDIVSLTKIIKAYESLFGFKIATEIGINDYFNLFQLRPIVRKTVKSLKSISSKIMTSGIIFSTMTVRGSYEYKGPLFAESDSYWDYKDIDPHLIRVYNPFHTLMNQRRGFNPSYYNEKYQYSMINIGDLRLSETFIPQGHGGVSTVEAPKDNMFIHPFVYGFVRAIGDIYKGWHVTPFNVHVISDGHIGLIRLPTGKDVRIYKEKVSEKIKEYEKIMEEDYNIKLT